MRIASFERSGTASFGIVAGEGIFDLGPRLPGTPDLKALLADPSGLASARNFAGHVADFPMSSVAFLPPVTNPERIIGIGVNYRDHAAELGSQLPAQPLVFVRWPSSVVGHLRPLVAPRASERFDFEGELAVIIGRRARNVPRERALDYVAGYSCFQDGSIRDWQRHTSQFTAGKNFPATGALGPWITTADEVADPSRLPIRTTINGAVVQDGTTADMIFDIPALIAYLSTFTELSPGDVIATGTPKGVGDGRKPPLYLKPGDTIEIAIAGVGTLRNPVVAEPAA